MTEEDLEEIEGFLRRVREDGPASINSMDFIDMAREFVPRLIAEIRAFKKQIPRNNKR